MEKMKGIASVQNHACNGKQPFLPPKSPLYGTCMESMGFPSPVARHELRQHQRTFSENILIEEQPSWLEDLLNEPEMPTRRGAHRRSSSDSFTYYDVSSISSNLVNAASLEYRQRSLMPLPSWEAPEYGHCTDVQYDSYRTRKPQKKGWGASSSAGGYLNNALLRSKSTGPLGCTSRLDGMTSTVTKMNDEEVSSHQSLKSSSETIEGTKQSQPDVDQKRMKQQYAQRSRVRKLQYIAELERNVEALQVEGSEISAEMHFLDQQNIILSLENETLRQRLDSLAQEHLIKQFQQEMLEREIARLRSFLLQQQQQPSASTHGRNSARDLDSQFANLSLKYEDANSARERVSATLRI